MNTFISTIINQYPRLSDEQTVALCEKIKEGDLKARNILALSNVGLIYQILRKMHVYENDIDDMFEECFVEYLEKMSRFDPTKGKFSTFFYGWLRDRIKRNNSLGIPVRVISNISRIDNVEEYYLHTYKRLPTDDELIMETGLSKKSLANFKADRNFFFYDSLDRHVSNEDGSATVGDFIEGDTNDLPETVVIYKELVNKLYIYICQLSNRQQLVLDCLYNLTGRFDSPLSFREIEKLTGIGRMTVASDRDAALAQLRLLYEHGCKKSPLAA